MVDIRGGEKNARNRVERLFRTQRINGVRVDIRPDAGQRWQPPENAGWYGIPRGSEPHSKFAVAQATIDTVDWIQLQASVFNENVSKYRIDRWLDMMENDTLPMGHDFLDSAYVPTVKATAKNPRQLPEPVLELERKAYEVKTQEGRSRGLGARLAELDRIPIWVAARRDRK